MNHKIYECSKCGDNIGLIGKLFFGLFHKCPVNEDENNFKNAKRYAILALAYWEKCDHSEDIQINIEGTSIYVRLGK